MAPSLTDSDWNVLRRLLEEVARLTNDRGVMLGVASRAMEFLPKLALRERALAVGRAERPPRGESASAKEKRIRREVRERDRGCTARDLTIDGTHIRCRGMLHFDHQWGRGKAEETTENVRQLCGYHHDLKTRSNPSRLFWLLHFRAHCERHGYGEEIVRCDRQIALERGQHPERAVNDTADGVTSGVNLGARGSAAD